MVKLRWPGMDVCLDFLRRTGDKLGRAPMLPVKVPVKIVCSCGQKYAFDVYPLNGRMPSPIKCPVCGVDGTSVANEIIAIALKEQPSPLMLRPKSLVQSPPAEVTPANAEADLWRKRA